MRNDQEAEPVDPRRLRRVLVAASLGTFVEWFDFAVYGFMAGAIAQHFFPANDPTTGLLQTFAVFAVAFALRPIGGYVFGLLGDRIGRKRVLSMTVLLIGASTTAIGVLPTYESIGILATVLLCLARAVQGFSAGGEYAGACTYVVEHARPDRRARYASFMPMATFVAFAAAAGISYAVEAWLDPAMVESWGWRIPFLIAAPVGLLGFYIRQRLGETPAFEELQEEKDSDTAEKVSLRSYLPSMVLLGGVISVSGLSFYTLNTYMSTYVQTVGGKTAAVALLASVVALTFCGVLAPIGGRLSDRIGRRPTAVAASVLVSVAAIPAFLLAGRGSAWLVILGQCLLAVGIVLSLVVVAVLMSELFPTSVRLTAAGLTYNIAYSIFAGTAPFVATFLVSRTGNALAPAFYLIVVGLIGLVCALRLPETAGRSINGHDRDESGTGAADGRSAVSASR